MATVDWQRAIFKRASVTYYTASLFFPQDVQQLVFTLYAFVRTVDDFVDATPQDAKGFYAFVKAYYQQLHGKRQSGNAIIHSFIHLQQQYRFKQVWVDAFLTAMELDLYKKVYRTEQELEHYMYGSAEVIGCMLCAIFGTPASLYPAARMLGRTMQYANFLRDIAEDKQLGRSYLSAESDTLDAVYSRACVRYAEWSSRAHLGIQKLPWELRIPVATATEMYDWTVTQIQKNPQVVWKKKIKPQPLRVFMTAVKLLVQSSI